MTKIIAVPTQEISEIVQKRLFELGYEWESLGKIFNDVPVRYEDKKAFISIEKNKTLKYDSIDFYVDYPHDFKEITMYELYQMKLEENVEVTVKVNGKISNKPLSIETARTLGIIE